MVTIEPATLLQVDASIIVGIFIFLTILDYTGRKPDNTLETKQKKEKFRFPSIAIIIFAASACAVLIEFLLYPSSLPLQGLHLLSAHFHSGLSNHTKTHIESLKPEFQR